MRSTQSGIYPEARPAPAARWPTIPSRRGSTPDGISCAGSTRMSAATATSRGTTPTAHNPDWSPVRPEVRPQFLVMVGDALGQRHHQADGMVGDLARAVVGRVADRDAQLAEALDVHIVVADPVLHEDPALAQLVEVL